MKREKNIIGGSEIATVMGLNRWKTPLRLWAEKTGKFETEDISGREYIQLGTELEDFVAKKFQRVTGKKVRRDTKTFRYKDYSYMVGHIDRRIVGTDELLECKTCNAWKEHEWDGEEIPQEYILQVMWYLGICGMSKGYIAVLIGGNKFKWKEIDFDAELFNTMVASAKEFIEYYCANDIAPVAVSNDGSTVMRLHPESDGQLIQVDDYEVNVLIRQRVEISKILDEAEKKKDDINSKLKQIIGEHDGAETGEYKIMWKAQSRMQLDYEKLKADNLYDKYSTERFSRVLRVNKKKGKK